MKNKLVRKNHKLEYGIVSLLLLIAVTLLITGVFIYLRRTAEDRYQQRLEEKERLIRLKAEEELRAKTIEERKAYVQTRSYMEDVAREVLGLVYKDEIIFRPNATPTPTPTPTPEDGGK
jgi:cell division protein DivIC